jgi:hypothetical protein
VFRGCLAVLLLTTGCDFAFRLDRLAAPIDAQADVPPEADASIDAPTILTCSTSPIILVPTDVYQEMWTDQVPTTGTHADKVADLVADDDATYIASMSDGQVDLFTHLPLAPDVQIEGIQFSIRTRIAEATAPSSQVGVAWLAKAPLQWDDMMITSTWADYQTGIYATNPNTGTAWTVDDVNEMTIGVRKAYSAYQAQVTRVWATIRCH